MPLSVLNDIKGVATKKFHPIIAAIFDFQNDVCQGKTHQIFRPFGMHIACNL